MTKRALSTELKRSTATISHNVLSPVPHVPLVPTRQALSKITKAFVQPKLKIGTPHDRYEQEADRVAEQVMRMPGPGAVQRQTSPPNIQHLCPECEDELQRKPQDKATPAQPVSIANSISPLVQRQEEPEEEEEEVLQSGYDTEKASPKQAPEENFSFLESVDTRDADELGKEEEDFIQPKRNTSVAPQVTSGIANNIQSLKGTGQPLPAAERAFFEPRFGMDFSQVRVHTDHRAARVAQSINARAFTFGRNVVFGTGQFVPGNQFSRKLLSHELVHVVQQQAAAFGARAHAPVEHLCQRQPRSASRYVSRATAQKAIEAYLRRASAAQNKGQLQATLKVTPVVRTGLASLFMGNIGRLLQLDSLLLTQTHLHGDPALLAHHVAKLLPPRVDRKKVENLARLPVTHKKNRLERLKDVLKPKPRQASPTQRAQPVRGPSSLERFERGIKQLRMRQGLPKIKTVGPYGVDTAAAARQLRKLTRKSARPHKPARTFPEVEKALGQFGSDALVPGSVLIAIQQATKAWEWAGPDEEPSRLRELKAARARKLAYASPHLVARDLARSMVTGDKNISLMLDDIYNSVRQRKGIYSELERIIRTVHSRLGSRAAKLVAVNVYFGQMLVRQIRLKP